MELRTIIKKFREEHNLSQREFAARCRGITNGYISMIEADFNNHTGKPPRPSVEKLEAIARGMGISLADLMDKLNDVPPTPKIPNMQTFAYTCARAMVPIIGSVRCGPGGLAYQELQGASMADVANPQDHFYLRVEGDSMAPDICAGDLALVHIQPEVENGQLAVVIVNGEEGTLKRFIRDGSTVILQSLNQAYAPRVFVGDEINALTVAGRVVETKRKW